LSSVAIAAPTNGIPGSMNVMKLPEPIEMPRTQNMNAKIRLANEVFPTIGTLAAPGVGSALIDYRLDVVGDQDPLVTLPNPPYAIQVGFVGRRIKDTQYGQVVRQGR
jgi:hypothetical protein